MRPGLFIHKITAQRRVGRNVSTDPVYSDKRLVSARVTPEVRRVRRGDDGEEVVSHTQVLALSPLFDDDRIWLPGTDVHSDDAAQEVIRASSDTTVDGRLTVWEARL